MRNLRATNGPDIANCNSVVKEAMDLHWLSKRGTWHYFRSSFSEKLKSFRGDIEVIDKIKIFRYSEIEDLNV